MNTVKTKTAFFVMAASAIAISGCSRASYESTPVQVQSAKGTVTCQLYTKDRTWWDEAIQHPTNMSKEEADAICIVEGRRRAQQ